MSHLRNKSSKAERVLRVSWWKNPGKFPPVFYFGKIPQRVFSPEEENSLWPLFDPVKVPPCVEGQTPSCPGSFLPN